MKKMMMLLRYTSFANVSGIHTESIPYHLRGTDWGQVEVMEWDEEAFQLSNQQQQNHTISKLDGKHTGEIRALSKEGDTITGEVIS